MCLLQPLGLTVDRITLRGRSEGTTIQDLLEKDKYVNDNPKIVRFHVTFQMRHVC